MIGQHLKQYQIETLLGQGGLGTVYRAQDNNLSRDVALKIIYPRFANRDALRTHIMTQAKTAARLSHPGIATIYDFAHNEDQLYLVIEFVPGHSLAHAVVQLCRRNKLLPLAETLWLTAQVAEALAHAHQNGMLHRNLKPSNILVKAVDKPLRAGERPLRAMLTDFGMTRLLSGDVQSASVALADVLPYMSPEQTVGQILDGRSDVYALGVILYQLATGRLPFAIKSPTEAMVKHCLDAPPPPQSIQPSLPDDVTAIINKALAKRAPERYQDAAEMADAIRRAAVNLATSEEGPAAARTVPFADLKLAYKAASEAVPVVAPGNGVLPMPADDLIAMLQAEIAPPERPAAAASDHSHREDRWPALIPQPANEKEAVANGVPVNQSQTTPVLASRRRTTPTPSQETGVPAIPAPTTDQIVIMRPGRAPRQVQLDKLQLQIGRSRDNDIVLATPDVSRRHAHLQKTENGWQVTDLNSSGGTYWGDHRLLPHVPEPWNHNQLLRIGPYTLRWQPAHTSLDVPSENHADQVTELHQVPQDGTQTGSSSGQFSLMVSPTVVTLAPAARTIMQVEIFNQGATADTFSLRVADLPPMLITLPQNSVHLAPGTRASLPITLAVPADGDPVAAGHYPFQIIVKAQRDAAETAVVSARLTISPLEKFSLHVWPLEMTNRGECQVMIRNEGNVDTHFSLTGQSPHAAVRFSGERGHVPLRPGQATTLALTVAATERPLFGRRRRRRFHVCVRTDGGAEQVETGRLDVEPKLPSWTLPVLEILLVALLFTFVITSFLNRSQNTDAANSPTVALPETATPAAGAAAAPAETTAAPTAADPTADDDGDGLSNGDEIELYNTDPALADTDGDGLDDGEELDVYGTEPTYADTDLDGVNDGEEVAKGTDPLRFPVTADTGDPAAAPTDPPPSDSTADPGGYVGESDAPEATAVPIVPTDPPAAGSNTVQLPPVADGSGWVSQSGEVNVGLDAPAQGGDLDNNQPVRGFFSYDLAQIPDGVTIESARLNFGAAETSIAGAPFGDLGCLLLEAVEFDLPLDVADFDASAFYIDCVNERPSTVDVAIDVQDALDFDLPYLQIRFGYDVATDNDGAADLFLVRSAPTLEVVYTTP